MNTNAVSIVYFIYEEEKKLPNLPLLEKAVKM